MNSPNPAFSSCPVNDSHRQKRDRRLFRAILSSLLIRPLAFITPLLTVPLFISYLGSEGFGLSESIASFASWLALSNAGMGLGLMNHLSACYVHNDQADARRYVSTLVVALSVICLVLAVLLLGIVFFLPWQNIFPTQDPVLARHVPWAVLATGLAMLASIPLGFLQPVYSAYQEIHKFNLWDGLRRIVMLGACIAVIYTPWGLTGVVLVVSGSAIPVALVNAWALFRDKPWLRPSLRLYDPVILRSLLTQGLGFFLLQMSVTLLYQTDRLVIASQIGPDAVAPYAVAARAFMTVHGVYMLILSPLWPAVTEAIRRGDISWVRRMLRYALLLGCSLMAVIGLAMFFWGNHILPLWTRDPSIHVSKTLILGMALTFIVRVWIDTHSVILNSAQIIRPQVVFLLIQAGIGIVACFFAARTPAGIDAVAWTAGLAGLLTTAWAYPRLLHSRVFTKSHPHSTDHLPGVHVPLE